MLDNKLNYMASLQSLQARQLAAQTTSIRVVDDAPVALRIVHKAANAVTSVTSNAGTLVLIDASGTTTVTYASAGTTTLGGVADYINGLDNWDCKVLDGLRSQVLSAGSKFITGALTANVKNGELGYDLVVDTSATFLVPVRVTYDRAVGVGIPLSGHRVKLVNFSYMLDVGTAAVDKVRVYEWDPVLFTETQIFSASSVKSTTVLTTHDFASGPITAKEGNDLIVVVTDGASLADAATNHLQAVYVRE